MGDGRRGRLISASDRKQAVELISEAVESGAALYKACEELGIHKRTYNRWKNNNNDYIDERTTCVRSEPANKLTKERPISTHKATAANQVWMWDITYLNGPIKGTYYYLYLFSDLYSRKIVGWEIWESETAEHANELIRKQDKQGNCPAHFMRTICCSYSLMNLV